MDPSVDSAPDAATPVVADGDSAPVVGMGLVGTRVGRLLISVVAIAMMLFASVMSSPDDRDSEFRDRVDPKLWEVARATGLYQNWGVFAPNPTKQSAIVEATVHYTDGTEELYRVPTGNAVVTLSSVRWRKFESRVRRNSRRHHWRPVSMWISRERTSDERAVEMVELSRVFADSPTPGTDEDYRWFRYTFYRYDAIDGIGRRIEDGRSERWQGPES